MEIKVVAKKRKTRPKMKLKMRIPPEGKYGDVEVFVKTGRVAAWRWLRDNGDFYFEIPAEERQNP